MCIFSARSIASKGKSDVKESTDSSTTLEDDDKGKTLISKLFPTFSSSLLKIRQILYLSKTNQKF